MFTGISGITSLSKANRQTTDGYDVFLIAGQSNTNSGESEIGESLPDATLDSTDTDILQLGRFSPNTDQVILATENLEHNMSEAKRALDDIGWGSAFAKQYKANGYLTGNRKILLVACGKGGTSFQGNHWNQGDVNYQDAIDRTATAMAAGTGVNVLKAVLWHQGESDAGSTANANAHAAAFYTMVDNMRTDLGNANLPFIAGGLLPARVAVNSNFAIVEAGIADLPNQRTYTGYADPNTPTELTRSSRIPSSDHFSARSVRGYPTHTYTDWTTMGLAGRYWTAYLSALTNT